MNFSAMLSDHPFWGLLTLAVLMWYSTITVYVAIRGVVDIKYMLGRLRAGTEKQKAGTEGSPRA